MPVQKSLRLPPEHQDAILNLSLAALLEEDAAAERDKTLPFAEWCKNHFGDNLWETQEQVAEAVLSNRQVAWKGCHGIGKSYSTARIILRWLASDNEAIVLLTGAQYETVKDTIFAEVLKAAISDRSTDWGQRLDGELRRGEFNFCRVFTTDRGARIQGYHGKILVVIDEAQSMLSDLMPALYGMAAGGQVHFLMLGNPTNPSGDFAKAFKAESGWVTFTTSAFDTPNLKGYTLYDLLQMTDEQLQQNPRPELIDKRWVVQMYHLWGENSPLWKGKVLAEFPDQSADSVIWTQWLDQARANSLPDPGDTDVDAGLDVAGGGKNETVLTLRTGGQILKQVAWTDSIADETGYTKILAELNLWKHRLRKIVVDSDGMGFTLARELRSLNFPARMFQGSKLCLRSSPYLNKKAEAWFAVRRMFELGSISGLTSDETYNQLAAPTYGNDPRTGKIVIENKKMLATRGISALDWADSLVLAFEDGEDIPDPKRAAKADDDWDDDEPAPAYLDGQRTYWSRA